MDKSEKSTKRKKAFAYDRSSREIQGLKSARMITDPPAILMKRPRLRGSRAKGLTYERHVARALRNFRDRGELHGEIKQSQWFSFEDANGHGYCQTDILIITKDLVFILECKLTYTDWAWPQLRSLYKPVVEMVFGKPAITLQVCKHLYYAPPGQIETIQKLMDDPSFGSLTWHFLG